MRLIPGKTKVKVELFKGVSLTDIGIGAVAGGLMLLVFVSNLPAKAYICLAITFLAAILLIRLDTEPSYILILRIIRHFSLKRHYAKTFDDKILSEMDDKEKLMDGYLAEDLDKPENTEPVLTKKQEKALFEKEKKILASKTATKEEKDAVWLARANRSAAKKANKKQKKFDSIEYAPMDDITSFTGIKDGYIEYGGQYYGRAIEIPPVEFRFFSAMRRVNSIENGVGRILRTINPELAANIVKIERPVLYDKYIEKEKAKMDEIRRNYEVGFINEQELKTRADVVCSRIDELRKFCFEEQVVQPFYYIVLFDSDKKQLDNAVNSAVENLVGGELEPHVLNSRELAVFLKYTNDIDFDEREIDNIPEENYAQWAQPQSVSFKARTVEVNHILTHNMRAVNYPNLVDDAWMAGLMTIPSTKVVIKCKQMDRQKSVTSIDHALEEIRDRLDHTGIESRRLELSAHAETLSELLATLQGDNEVLLSVNIYITSYDIGLTRNTAMPVQPGKSMRTNVTNMKKTVRRLFSESRIRLEGMDFNQMAGYLGGQVSAYDPLTKDGRGMPGNSVAAAYPWVYQVVADENGVKIGISDDVPVFIDFFRRDSERVNSNMVIVGKSGSGKSYATKSILTNLAADGAKIFILDPENEYSELAHNLHGKMINVGNASQGRLNPFHIITALDDDESGGSASGNSYATHLQFLEEFFKQSLPDCEKDALEYLNSLIDRMYINKGITAETNLSTLKPEDYPIFDDLYDIILREFQSTDSEYIRNMLRSLMNYISKYSTGGRNAAMWNGPSTVTTEENFTVFNFQSLLANRNSQVANSQMLLVLKYIDNEIIKNRDYNTKYKTKRKVVVVIDEAHVFIDAKYPVALDFMFQLAKRIRKYNGMQVVITQNIKDFVGSEELARKSTAIINACQYSFIFSLAPNDMDDLCTLYEKAGGINENEVEEIVSAPRGQAFTILSPKHRTTVSIKIPQESVQLFRTKEYKNVHFSGEEGEKLWEEYIGESRDVRMEYKLNNAPVIVKDDTPVVVNTGSGLMFEEISEEEYLRQEAEKFRVEAERQARQEIADDAKQQYRQELKNRLLGVNPGQTPAAVSTANANAGNAGYADNNGGAGSSVSFEATFEDADELPAATEEAGDEDGEIDIDLDMFDEETPDSDANAEASGNMSRPMPSNVPQTPGVAGTAAQPMMPAGTAPTMPLYMQTPAPTTVLESILIKLSDAVTGMSNRGNIMDEVNRLLDARLQGITGAAAVPAPAASTQAPADTTQDDSDDDDDFFRSLFEDSDTQEADGDDSFGSLFDDDKSGDGDDLFESLFGDESADGTADSTDTTAAGDTGSDGEEDGFDILSFLAEEAKTVEDATPIEDMLNSDTLIVTVTLQELAAYNLKQRQ